MKPFSPQRISMREYGGTVVEGESEMGDTGVSRRRRKKEKDASSSRARSRSKSRHRQERERGERERKHHHHSEEREEACVVCAASGREHKYRGNTTFVRLCWMVEIGFGTTDIML